MGNHGSLPHNALSLVFRADRRLLRCEMNRMVLAQQRPGAYGDFGNIHTVKRIHDAPYSVIDHLRRDEIFAYLSCVACQ